MRPELSEGCFSCGSSERTAVRSYQGCGSCSRTRGRRSACTRVGVFSVLAAVTALYGCGSYERPVEDPSVVTFLGSVPEENSWWDAPGCVASVWGRRPCTDELSSPSVKDKPFETCLLQRSGDAWRLWDSRGLRSGPSVALSGDIPVTERLAVFRTRRGPKWAGWVKGSATVGLKCSAAARDASAADTASNPSYHIVESWDIEKMMEEPPTDYYYDRLSEDLRKRHPQADSHLIDHLVSLEAFLDKSILFGFSFGINKAEVAVAEGKLLGHKIGRSGSSPDEERCQAVVDFPPLREKLHIQQFLGCANWLRGYLPAEYGHAAKVLGQWQKPGAEFPEGGLGAGATAGCKAFKAIKQMMRRHICLASFDEAAAADGSCPLNQIADASGIAVGGSVLQMTRDLSRVKVLMTHSKSLTPAQQNWPPLIQEAFAQLEVKRATRRTFGSIRTVCWTDHANLTRAQTSDIGLDPKLVRWVGEILLDGSEIRSLSGRSATLGDSFSRNPKDRDRLLEARTRDLQRISGRLRGFDLDQYLGEGTEGTGPVPWAVGSDAVPDTVDRAPVAVPVAVATEVPVRVMVVFDYLRWSEQDRLAGTKRVKRLRVDLLTSCAKVLREATGFKPQFLVGLGQGGLVAAVLRWPLVVELTLQARNLQRKEARAAGEAWAGIKAIWSLRPRLWRTQSGHQEIAESCPELQKDFPEPPLRGFGVVGKIAAGDEVLRCLRLDGSKGIEESSIRGMLSEPSREMWDHDGLCACGKRTYLFSRCPSCIEQEALDTAVEIAEREDAEVRGSSDRDPESPEVGVEVNGVLAARERAGGVLEVPSSAVQSWAAGFLQAPRDEAVQTLFGSLRGRLWKGGSHLTLSRGTSTDQLKYITAWVVREGVVVLGHNSSPVDTIKSGVVLSWSVEPNWHGHRHLINAVCETLWRASGQEMALDPAFDRLLCMIGKPRRVEGWFDSEGEACIAHRRGLRKQGVLATFRCVGEGHWTTAPLTAKIVVDESNKARTLCFVGDLHQG